MKSIFIWYKKNQLLIQLLPFLVVYSFISYYFAPTELFGDEGRYIRLSNNLLNGFFSPPYPNINLWSGPGYPLLITPFVFFNCPFVTIRILNAFLLYFSLIVIHKTLRIYHSKKKSLFFVLLTGVYFPVFQSLPFIFTECLSWFLISLISYLFLLNFKNDNISWKLVVATAFFISYLSMVKVIFGYVIISMIFICSFLMLFKKVRISAKKSLFIFLFSLFFCIPYLVYTYNLTNKIFYWSNSGSMSLYTMSTPFENEYGDWKGVTKLLANENHKHFIDSILNLPPLKMEEAYKNAAINNIKNHPQKYLYNWVANIGRLLFQYPYSNSEQKINSYFIFVPNMFVVVFIFLSLLITFVKISKLPQGLLFLLLFIIIYLFGSSIVSAYLRMFYITLPFWVIFISYISTKIVSIKYIDYKQ